MIGTQVSAPMGNLVAQAPFCNIEKKLSKPEYFARITFRAAAALTYRTRGTLEPGIAC